MDRHPQPAADFVNFDALVAGELLPTVEFAISADAARDYLLATGGRPSAFGDTAPPLALVAFALAAMTDRMPLPRSTQHVGQEVRFTGAMPLGATVGASFRLEARRVVGQQAISVFRFELHEGERMCARGRITLRHQVA